jgi:ABC-type sulfate/molybdate transport systems ATPase subunit
MTVFQNLAFGLQLKKMPKAQISKKVAEGLTIVKLEELEDRYPRQLSGGQQQRVALARALVLEPDILLLDEPLSNLDALLREQMRFEIAQLHKQYGITTIYVTHDQTEAMVILDRIAVLNKGKLLQLERPRRFIPAWPTSSSPALWARRTSSTGTCKTFPTTMPLWRQMMGWSCMAEDWDWRRARTWMWPSDRKMLSFLGSLRLQRHTEI